MIKKPTIDIEKTPEKPSAKPPLYPSAKSPVYPPERQLMNEPTQNLLCGFINASNVFERLDCIGEPTPLKARIQNVLSCVNDDGSRNAARLQHEPNIAASNLSTHDGFTAAVWKQISCDPSFSTKDIDPRLNTAAIDAEKNARLAAENAEKNARLAAVNLAEKEMAEKAILATRAIEEKIRLAKKEIENAARAAHVERIQMPKLSFNESFVPRIQINGPMPAVPQGLLQQRTTKDIIPGRSEIQVRANFTGGYVRY